MPQTTALAYITRQIMKNKLASSIALLSCSGHEPFHLASVFQTTYLPHQEDEEKIIKRGWSLFRHLVSSLQSSLSRVEDRRSTTEGKQSLQKADHGADSMLWCYWTQRSRFMGLTRTMVRICATLFPLSSSLSLLSPCLLPHLCYYIYVRTEHTQSLAHYNSHHTNHLTVMIPAPFMRSVTNYSWNQYESTNISFTTMEQWQAQPTSFLRTQSTQKGNCIKIQYCYRMSYIKCHI